MRKYAPKVKKRNVVLRRTLLVVLIVFIGIAGKATWNVYEKERDTRERLLRVELEHERLIEEKEFLDADIVRLESDVGIEEEIRDIYGFGREGEQVIIVVQDESEVVEGNEDKKGIWSRLKDLFVR